MIDRLRGSALSEQLLATTLILVLVSAVWIETDAYRYASLLLAAYGLHRYVNDADRPPIGWIDILCLAWPLYVAIRYAAAYLALPNENQGSSEGIYLFPALYGVAGYALWHLRAAVEPSIRSFLFISLAVVALTVPIAPTGNLEIYDFLLTNNTIHSSVCGGFIIVAALNIAAAIWRRDPPGAMKTLYLIAAYVSAVLCAIGIYWARSRGVWVALGFALFAQVAVSVSGSRDWRAVSIGGALLVALATFVALDHADLWKKIGPSFDAAWTMARDAYATGDMLNTIDAAIASGSVPPSMNERLMLWSNALEVWANAPLFGNGIGWEERFLNARYRDAGYNLLHNGYLEIAVRYGWSGLAFYAVLYTWSLTQSHRAYRAGLIAREAFAFHLVSLVFFLATILTNSNNRLAIGESYMLLAAAFGFFCHFSLQKSRRGSANG